MFEVWIEWRAAIESLRRGFSRQITFCWFSLSLMAMMMKPDKYGVTSFVRVLKIDENYYKRWLESFQSSGVKLDELSSAWHDLVNKKTLSTNVLINNRPVYVGDGIKDLKEGFRMPSVKSLHQESNNNSKPEYIMGHSCQIIAKLAASNGQCVAIPIVGKIHEGYVESNRDKRTLHDKFIELVNSIGIRESYLVLDAYYSNRKIFSGLLTSDNHCISRMRINTVAFEEPIQKVGRGRPKKYGKKIRFVLVSHPIKGRVILVSTDLTLEPMEIIKSYGMRFKIEVMFKEAVHTIGTFSYRFWMQRMGKKRRGDGDDYLHRKMSNYRQQYISKVSAYNTFIQAGLIAQGFLQLLSQGHRETIWENYPSWMRTMNFDANPSEAVVAETLKSEYPAFLSGLRHSDELKKFIKSKMNPSKPKTEAKSAA